MQQPATVFNQMSREDLNPLLRRLQTKASGKIFFNKRENEASNDYSFYLDFIKKNLEDSDLNNIGIPTSVQWNTRIKIQDVPMNNGRFPENLKDVITTIFDFLFLPGNYFFILSVNPSSSKRTIYLYIDKKSQTNESFEMIEEGNRDGVTPFQAVLMVGVWTFCTLAVGSFFGYNMNFHS